MSRPRILVTGAQGQVGHELAHLLTVHADVVATDRSTLDLANPDAIVAAMRDARPDIVINAGAYTAVDLAEREHERAFAINAQAPRIFAEEARRAGALLIHYSTDYVFDGTATAPYAEDAPTAPLNVYGASKLEGERAIAASGAAAIVLRTSWVYGLRGKNFLLTIRRLAAERDELRIVADQMGTPNWARTLAQATTDLVGQGTPFLVERAGLYHLSGGGSTTWHGFAQAIVSATTNAGAAPVVPRVAPRVVPIASSDYPTPARRPAYGVLGTESFARTFGQTLPHWRDTLAACLGAASV